MARSRFRFRTPADTEDDPVGGRPYTGSIAYGYGGGGTTMPTDPGYGTTRDRGGGGGRRERDDDYGGIGDTDLRGGEEDPHDPPGETYPGVGDDDEDRGDEGNLNPPDGDDDGDRPDPGGGGEPENPGDDFLDHLLGQYNAYLTDMVEASREEMDARLREREVDAQRGIGEWAASRGLVGSSLEGQQHVNLAGDLQRAQLAEEQALQDRLARGELAGLELAARLEEAEKAQQLQYFLALMQAMGISGVTAEDIENALG